jgi:hypothetical protein
MYSLRVHSIRKYFRTQLAALGMPSDYIEYMVDRTINTYNNIKMKGVEFSRNIYATSGLSIRPKMKARQIDILKEIIKALGGDPEKGMLEQAFFRPHRTAAGAISEEDVLKLVRKELLKKMGAWQTV